MVHGISWMPRLLKPPFVIARRPCCDRPGPSGAVSRCAALRAVCVRRFHDAMAD